MRLEKPSAEFLCASSRYSGRTRPEEFKNLSEQRPFVPVRLLLTGGSAYDILRDDLVFLVIPAG